MDNISNYNQTQEQCTTIKPAFKPSLVILIGSIAAIPISLFVGLFFGVKNFSFFIGIGSFLLSYLFILSIIYFFTKITLENIEYKFYSNRVEYYDGFLVKNRKTINYDRISNISQIRGIIERMWGLGTIYIDTPGSSTLGHELSMSYLENSDQIYDWINQTTQKK